jgi:uncharacterized protein
MPYISRKHVKRLDPRGPLVFDTRTLGPGLARVEDRTVPAPPGLGVELVSIPAGADLQLSVQLEGVVEGTLVTATARAPLAGECARCLDPFTSATEVRLQELFAYEAGSADADSYLQAGDLLDLEPALRDAGPGHGHAAEGAQQQDQPMPDGIPVPELRPDGIPVPELRKER